MTNSNEDLLDLNQKAVQTRFGALVGVTPSAISKHVQAGVLPKNATYREWLMIYCESLRDTAAGRGGDGQAELTKWRTEEAKEKALALYEERLKKNGTLIYAGDIKPLLTAWQENVKRQMTIASASIVERISSKYKIEDMDGEPIDAIIRDALRATGNHTKKLIRSLRKP